MSKLKVLVSAASISVLAACGGGGGGGGGVVGPAVSDAPVGINSDNAVEVAAQAAVGLGITGMGAEFGDDMIFGVATSSSGQRFDIAGFSREQLLRVATLDTSLTADQAPSVAGVFGEENFSFSFDCDQDSGSITTSWDGVTMSMVFNNCFDSFDETFTNGALRMTDITASEDFEFAPNWNMSATMVFDNLTISWPGNVTDRIHGSMAIELAAAGNIETATMTVSEMRMETVCATMVLRNYVADFIYDSNADSTLIDMNGQVLSSVSGGSVDLTTLETLEQLGFSDPHAGQIRINGDNSSLTLTFMGGGLINMEVFEGGQLTHSDDITWDELDQLMEDSLDNC